MIKPVFRAGETYAFSPDISEEEAYRAWIEAPLATYVAVNENKTILGTYYIKPNQPSLGAHVANCGYIVAQQFQNRGIAAQMCDHSQAEAVRAGFLAMQFNLVVTTNESAIHLWQKKGFAIIGTLPKAFLHKKLGLTDACVMYKMLDVPHLR